MRRVGLFVLAWLVTGVCTVGGSILGNAGGKTMLFAGAALGGALGAVASAWIASRIRLIERRSILATAAGGVVGFAVAVPIAVNNLHTPVIPIAATALVGLGAVAGSLKK